MTGEPPPPSGTETPHVLAIAHGAGNTLSTLQEAVHAGVDVIEADVHHYRGRLEVRHLKTLGPLPLLWDRWELAPAWAPRLLLPELLAAADAGIPVMLDVKGRRVGTGMRIAEVLHEHAPGRSVWVCGRYWPALEGFSALPWVRIVFSARNRMELAALRRRVRGPRPPYGVSIHRGLVSSAVVGELRERVPVVMTWPVDHPAVLDQVLAAGVSGVISSDPDVLRLVIEASGAGPVRRTGRP